MDEIDEDRSNRLKESIFKYFDQHSKMTADTGDMALMSIEDGNETGQLPPVLFKVSYLFIYVLNLFIFCISWELILGYDIKNIAMFHLYVMFYQNITQ